MKWIGKYEILRHISTGGMAEVYLARQRGIGGFSKLAILKLVRSDLADDQDFVRMFLQEARLTASLEHSGIGQVFDVGESGGRIFMAMEFIRGETLRLIARTCRERSTPFPLSLILYISCRACEALEYIHTHDPPVIHRDISPQNIMISFDGAVKLIDFGVAKSRELAEDEATAQGILKGKIGYMAPEQIRGQPVTPRSDIFSFGIVLWEVLAGRRLFRRADRMQTLQAVLQDEIPALGSLRGDVPPALDRCLTRALARPPQDRFASAKEMLGALEEIVAQHHLHASQAQLSQFVRNLLPERLASQQRILGAQEREADLEAWLFDDLRFDFDRDGDSFPPNETSTTSAPIPPSSGPAAAASSPSPGQPSVSPTGSSPSAPSRAASVGPPTLLNLAEMLEGPERPALEARRMRRAFLWRVLGWALLGALTLAALVGAWLWRQHAVPSEEPAGPPATLRIASNPPGAQVWLDGRLQEGKTPLRLQTSSGREHLLRVRLPKRPDWNGNVRLAPGEVKDLQIRL
ncbi:MAG: protein kinase [Myxococcales bacterium]|nr:protein kinase [Myxococcales bacterium]